MSWEIKQSAATDLVLLDSEMGIQSAADFYQAVLPLAGSGKALRIDASATKSVHTSIIQILYALSQTVEDFGITNATEPFRSAEARLGLSFPKVERVGHRGNRA